MKITFLIPIVLFTLALYACSSGRRQETTIQTPGALLQSLIAAINKSDEKELASFFTSWGTSDPPPATRAKRMVDFGRQGAPFKIVGVPTSDGKTISAAIEDREGTKLTFRMGYTTNPLKMSMLQVQPASNAPTIRPWSTLQNLVEQVSGAERSPGMGVCVIRDGKAETVVTGIRELGMKDLVAESDPWSIGSIGKPLCTTIIGLLIEQGKLRWDETLKEALPDVPMKSGYEQATLEQIMHHRGGIPQDENFNRQMVQRIVGTATKPFDMRANYVRDILSREPIGKPGEHSAYSNAGYAILGHIAERVTGKSYEDLVKDMIFKPLGLKHSYTGIDTLPKDRPSGHMPGPDGLKPFNMLGPIEFLVAPAGGGMYMSVGDLAKFGVEHLKGLRGENGLLKASTVERLHRGIPEDQGGMLYACGWGIEQFPGVEQFHGHNGSNGTMRAQLCIFPKANLVVAAIANRGGEQQPAPGLTAALEIARKYARLQ